MRQKIVAANWKMNKQLDEAIQLLNELIVGLQKKKSNTNVVIFPPSLYLKTFEELLFNANVNNIQLGAQNCYSESKGAFTGEIAADMIRSVGAKYVIVGHSERRILFGETNEVIFNKVTEVLKNQLIPIFCVGESLLEREQNIFFDAVKKQIADSLFYFSNNEIKSVVIAYEPVWAIGTGKTASIEQAQEMHFFIRQLLSEKYGNDTAQQISILYGGSCNAQNAPQLFSCKDIDGGLIGGASLVASSFIDIVNSF